MLRDRETSAGDTGSRRSRVEESLKRAIISDIHANLPALEAVLGDIEKRDVDSIYCLGDVIGYGPFPRQCLEKAKQLVPNLVDKEFQWHRF